LLISALAGAVFGVAVMTIRQSRPNLVPAGIIAGGLVFLLGPLTLVPMAIGLRPQFPHIAKWLVLGVVHYAALGRPVERRV